MDVGDEERLNVWGRRGVRFAWIAAALLALPALVADFSLDDFLQRLILEGRVPEMGLGPATLYDFMGGNFDARAMLERGYLPWQTEPKLLLRFFRPLGSLSIALDHALFGRAALPSHLMSVALFLATLGAVIALFRRVLTPNRAGLAAFLFAVAGGHSFNLAWVAGRHILVGGLFGALSLLIHVQNAERRAPRWLPRWLAPVSLFASMLASETSLAVLAALASYELLATDHAPRTRWLRAAPWLAAGLAYVGLYAAAGYGVQHSGLYLSPLSVPGAFFAAAVTRLPILLGELAFAVPAFVWGRAEPARPFLALLGAATTVLVTWLAWRGSPGAAERRKTAWFSAAALLGTLPVLGGVLDGRMLLVPLMASCPLVATAIDGSFGVSGRRAPLRLRACGGLLLFLHVVFAALVRVGTSAVWIDTANKQRALAASTNVSSCSAGSPLLVVTGADPGLLLAGGPLLAYYRPEIALRHPRFSVLSMAAHDLRLERTGEQQVVLDVVGMPRRVTIFERLLRDRPLAVGQRVVVGYFEAVVLATEKGVETRVAFELPANACLLTLERQKLVGRPLPPVGTRWDVPHELGPLGL